VLPIAFATALLAPAQSKPAGPATGGAIQVPGQELKILVDLAQNAKAIGSARSAFRIRIEGLCAFEGLRKGASVAFVMNGIPGDPSFEGQLSSSGKEIKGNFSQNGALLTFELKWVSEPA